MFPSKSFVGLALMLRPHWLLAVTGNHHMMYEAE